MLGIGLDVPGPVVDRLGEIAREHSVHLVIGVIERDGGTLYCTALFVGPDGGLLGKHRKLMPTAAERLVWGFGDGSTLPVLDTAAGRLGAVICWENYMPLLRTAMYSKGIQLYCAPTADARDCVPSRSGDPMASRPRFSMAYEKATDWSCIRATRSSTAPASPH